MYKSDRRRVCVRGVLKKLGLGASALVVVVTMQAQQDPGVRAGAPQAGGHLAGLSNNELTFFNAGQAAFNEIASVSGTVTGTEPGLGPRFNLDSCAGCHAFPAVGGSSPAANPQVTRGPLLQVAVLVGLGIIRPNGPVREVRFKSDGGVHDLFTIAGRNDRPQGCNIGQPAFLRAVIANDAIFRVPTPTFGAGLIEAIDDSTILANVGLGASLGITGRANRSGNDGSITRFGWKAQNKSLVIFSGEAYNVEQGITNELFPDERGEGGIQDPASCRVVPKAQDLTHFDETTTPSAVPGDAVAFANFMRFLAAPAPASSGYTTSNGNVVTAASISRGQSLFGTAGCAFCHVPSMTTGNHSVPALANQPAGLFSDLLVHDMGRLGDGISQGNAGPTEFRTAPLWGLGQRIFFLHDGRTSDLTVAIEAHADSGADHGSEALAVINNFNALTSSQKQDLLNFLRSL